jgi:hypothetical protein
VGNGSCAKTTAASWIIKPLEGMRLRAVDAVESGVHPEDVAALGMARGTVYWWLATYREGGKER